MPSLKTASYTKYLERLQYFWTNVAFMLNFRAKQAFLKWKFFRQRMARVAVDAIAKRIVPTVSMKTCVAYGDWSKRGGIKGHAISPVKGLARALQKRATDEFMDEFITSKLCSQCQHVAAEEEEAQGWSGSGSKVEAMLRSHADWSIFRKTNAHLLG